MDLQHRFAREMLRAHPERAASALERLEVEAALDILAGADATECAAVLRRLSPQFAIDLLEALEVEKVAKAFEALPLDAASRFARRLGETHQTAVLEELPPGLARSIRSLLRFPEHSAGAMMDPDVLALPESLSAQEAVARVRSKPETARYNLYVLDHSQKLIGVVNLRELFLAPKDALLSSFMVREPLRLNASADRASVLGHHGWKEVHALPVVDDEDCYLGAVRYRTLRQLQEVLIRSRREDGNTSEALGQLFSAGAVGLLDALTMDSARKGG